MKIGVGLPMIEDDGKIATYSEIRAFAHEAEAAGFDSIWAYDHLLYRQPGQPTKGIWEAWTVLAALTEATERVELGALVICTAFRNPAVLAKMANDLDAISGGRFILGLGAGWHQPEFEAFGIPFDHRVDRFEEALQIIVPLLRTGSVDFSGRYYQAPNAELAPRGIRPNGPPILIGAFGPRMLGLTARYADLWNTCWLGEATALDAPRATIERACAEVGRDPATLGVTVGVMVADPEAGPPMAGSDKLLAGTAAEVGAGIRAYAAKGVAHVICRLNPAPTPAGLRFLSQALNYARS